MIYSFQALTHGMLLAFKTKAESALFTIERHKKRPRKWSFLCSKFNITLIEKWDIELNSSKY